MYLGVGGREELHKSVFIYFSISISLRFMICGAGAGSFFVCMVLHTMQLSSERFGCYHAAHNNIFT